MIVQVIPTRVHGVLDYATSGALLAAPELLRLKSVRRSALSPRVAGAGSAAYSALTDYELGAAKWIPMRVHLALDAVSGALLASSPWLLGYRKHGTRHWLPHTLVGASELLVALASKTESPSSRPRGMRRTLVPLALSSALAAALVAKRRRVLDAVKGRSPGGSSDDAMFTSVGMASAGPGSGESDTSEPSPPASETPSSSAPPA